MQLLVLARFFQFRHTLEQSRGGLTFCFFDVLEYIQIGALVEN